jgi:Xaa-Pro dipeptidase
MTLASISRKHVALAREMRNLPFDQRVANENFRKLRNLLEQRGVDLLIGADPGTVRYLTGRGVFHTRSQCEATSCEVAIVALAGDRPFVFVPPHHLEFWKERVSIVDAHPSTEMIQFLEAPERANVRNVEVSSDTPWRISEQAKSILKQASFQLDGNTISESRLQKSDLELKAIRRAAKVSVVGMETALDSCKPGTRECEAAGNAERAMRRLGAEGFGFSTVVSSGPNAGLFSEISTKKKIRKGETVVIDLGATVDGYNSEFSRTAMVGKPRKMLAKTYNVVYEALRTSIDMLREGNIAGDVDSAARRIISSNSLPVHKHYTGHGVGTGAYESPLVGPGSNEILRVGMVVALEPGSYYPGIGGVKLEDNVIVTRKGPVVITKASFEEDFV